MFFLDVADLKRLQNKKNVTLRGLWLKMRDFATRTYRKVLGCEINN